MPDPAQRASDEDRERAVEQLRTNAAAGRLDTDELEERVEAALRARTLGELQELRKDLPQERPARPHRHRHRRHRHGVRSFVFLSSILIAIWAMSGADYFWPAWPMLWFGFAFLGPGRACGARRRHRLTQSSAT